MVSRLPSFCLLTSTSKDGNCLTVSSLCCVAFYEDVCFYFLVSFTVWNLLVVSCLRTNQINSTQLCELSRAHQDAVINIVIKAIIIIVWFLLGQERFIHYFWSWSHIILHSGLGFVQFRYFLLDCLCSFGEVSIVIEK